MKKKKMLSMLLAVMMVSGLIFTGCGSKGEGPADSVGSGDSGEDGKEDGGYVIGFANASVSNSWRVKMRDMLIEEAEKLGVEMELPEEITCGFSEENQQCLKKHCPYYKCT